MNRIFVATDFGGSNDTQMLQAAINAVQEEGGALYIPAGDYHVTGLTITGFSLVDGVFNTSRIKIYGDQHETRIIGASANPIFTIGNSGGTRIFDIDISYLHIDGDGTATDGIKIQNATRINLNNLRIFNNTESGIAYDEASYGPHNIEQCFILENSGDGVTVSDSTDNGNALRINNSNIQGNGGAGVNILNGASYDISSNTIQFNQDGGVVVGTNAKSINIVANYFESHVDGLADHINLGDTVPANISGNYFLVNSGGRSAIYLNRSRGVSIIGNYFRGTSTGTQYGIVFDNGAVNHRETTILSNTDDGTLSNMIELGTAPQQNLLLNHSGYQSQYVSSQLNINPKLKIESSDNETQFDFSSNDDAQVFRFYCRDSDNVFGMYNVTRPATWFRYTGGASAANDKLALLELGGSLGIGNNSPGERLDVSGNVKAESFITTEAAPASASDTGTEGEIRVDANYIYVCTATDTWKRVAIATW